MLLHSTTAQEQYRAYPASGEEGKSFSFTGINNDATIDAARALHNFNGKLKEILKPYST